MRRIKIITQFLGVVPPVFYGFAFHHAWSVMESGVSIPYGASIGSFSSGATAIIVLMCFAVLSLKAEPERFRKVSCWVAFACLAGAVALFGLSMRFESLAIPLHTLSTVFATVGTIVYAALWIDIYARLNPVRAVFTYAASVLAAQALCFLLEDNPFPKLLIILALLAALSPLSYLLALRKSQGISETAEKRGGRIALPWKILVPIAMYSFAYGFASQSGIGGMGYASVLPALLIVLLVLLYTKRFSLSIIFKFAMPLMIAGFLAMQILGEEASPHTLVVFRMGFAALEMMTVMAACIIAFTTGASAIWLFCLMRAVQFFMRHVGSYVPETHILEASPYAHLIVGVVIIALCLAASIPIFTEKNLLSPWGASLHDEPESSVPDMTKERVKAKIFMLAKERNLTDREIEVVHLTVQGLTNYQIATRICVAEGTVKAHLNHIYQKTGVKSRKELMEAVGVDPRKAREESAALPLG